MARSTMRRRGFAIALVICLVAAFHFALAAVEPTPPLSMPRRSNQVFVKVIVPGNALTKRDSAPVVESWIAEQLKQLGESECFAATEWVPLYDEFRADNDVWDGFLNGKHSFCPVHGHISERKDGGVKVQLDGWSIVAGCEVNLTLADEPGSRGVGAVQIRMGPDRFEPAENMPFVAVLIAPPTAVVKAVR